MKTSSLFFIVSTTILSLPSIGFVNKTVCDYQDARTYSYDNKIGKIVRKVSERSGCTMTLIGNDCAISAGHCLPYLKLALFNVTHSNENGKFPLPQEEDIYEIERESIVTSKQKGFSSNDWLVFKLKPNNKTGLSATDKYGHYSVASSTPWYGGVAKITGYGISDYHREESYTQKTHLGKVEIDKKKKKITYRIDTTGGNSGSSIILERTGEIIGIHTNGGCSGAKGNNKGVLIPGNRELEIAIRYCLKK